MNTNAEDRDINQVNRTIHQWMGLHWHEYATGGPSCICYLCDEVFTGNRDYTSSLDAVAEAEKKAVLRFGTDEYAWALAAVLKIRMDDYEPIQTQDYVAFALAEPKDRAATIFNLIITENAALEVK